MLAFSSVDSARLVGLATVGEAQPMQYVWTTVVHTVFGNLFAFSVFNRFDLLSSRSRRGEVATERHGRLPSSEHRRTAR